VRLPRATVCTSEDAVYRLAFQLTREQAEWVAHLREHEHAMFGGVVRGFLRRYPDADVKGPLDGEDLIWSACKVLNRPIDGSWHEQGDGT
jgi:hypothetical protein